MAAKSKPGAKRKGTAGGGPAVAAEHFVSEQELRHIAEQVFKLIDSVFSESQLPDIGDDRKPKKNPLNANFDKQEFKAWLLGKRLIRDKKDSPIDYAARIESKIVLIEGEQLAQMMIDHNIGVTTVASYEVKRIDSDYFTGQ